MIAYYFKKITQMPLKMILTKICLRLQKKFQDLVTFIQDICFSTYTTKLDDCYSLTPYLIFADDTLKLNIDSKRVILLSENFLNHYFDLLGSGWVQVKYGMNCCGLEGFVYKADLTAKTDVNEEWIQQRINFTNRKQSQNIRRFVEPSYIPIDWQLDFKSGYRWKESTWYKYICFGRKPGVDVKVPWELARMQHLPMLAWTYGFFIYDNREKAQAYLREFRNEILDFIVNNPPRFGVNWFCTMDVGIRIVSWLIAYDLFRAFGATFDTEFENILQRSVYEHGKHIIGNLEYTPNIRSNHYLSDIGGLLFVSAYLPRTEEIDCWLVFAVQELISEMEHEFNPDGSNFEASTSYHRLSTEIMLYCSILCLTLPEEKKIALTCYDPRKLKITPKLNPLIEQQYDVNNPNFFPVWFWERLEKAAEFTKSILKSTGEIPQFGDNDSGRFLKLWPSYAKLTVREAIETYRNLDDYREFPLDSIYMDERILDHSHLLGVASIIFNRVDLCVGKQDCNPEVELVKLWLNDKSIFSYRHKLSNSIDNSNVKINKQDILQWINELEEKEGKPIETIFTAEKSGSPLDENFLVIAYPDFGLYLYRSKRLYLAIRCGSIGQKGNGGHAHNDQLSIELNIDGVDIIRDPGTYLYTPLPKRRNQFRSTLSHFTPQLDNKEQNEWVSGRNGLFHLINKTQAECLFFGPEGFVGKHEGFGKAVYRIVIVTSNMIKILDFGGVGPDIPKIYSNGYGKLLTIHDRV